MEISRALMTLAFVHDRFVETGDIRSGLAPLFGPIARENIGKDFDSEKCSEWLRNRYDIVIQPAAVESLAPALKDSGVLVEERVGGTVLLRYGSSIDVAPPLEEQTIDQCINSFLSYAQPRLKNANVSIPEETLTRGLLDRLVRLEFLHILLRAHHSHTENNSSHQLGRNMPLRSKPTATDNVPKWLDFLCASFLLYCKREDQVLFELLVHICSGALLAEVVLDIQEPTTDAAQLADLTILLDGPLVLDLLKLSDDEHYKHMSSVIRSARKASAKIAVLSHSIEEMRGAIFATLKLARRHEQAQHGPLGRRLPSSPTLQTYASTVASDLQRIIQRMNIEILAPSRTIHPQALASYPDSLDAELAGRLPGLNVDTRLRDAKSVLDVLRLRGDEYLHTPIARSGYIFVSRNDTLVHRSRTSLIGDGVLSEHSAAPAITDRHLSGLLWVIGGGKETNLTRTQLIANCSAAVAPRQDVITRMYDFLSDLDPEKRPYFEALMTQERACQVLMEKTLGDATLVTKNNFAEIYAQIEQTAGERVTADKDAEIKRLKGLHVQELAVKQRELAEQSERAEEAQSLVEEKDQELRENLESGRQEVSEAQEREMKALNGIASNCLKVGLRAGRTVRAGIIALTVVIIAGVAWTIDRFDAGLPWIAYLIGGGLVVFELCAKPDWFIVRPVSWAREKAFQSQATKLGATNLLDKFAVDWNTKQVTPKKASRPNRTDAT